MGMNSLGPYDILEKLGSGGMGTVYRARHTETGQIVALKVMRADFTEDPSYLRRFRREAAIAESVESPNIVAVLGVGQQEGMPYIAMELVEGETLASLLRKSGPLPLDHALDIAIQAAQGLYAAHQKGIIHRDISPQNILVTPDGTAKIADFGIARSQTSGTLTGTGVFLGKPSYAAPEMLAGQANTRSDIYSLGVVLFEMLSSRPPFIAPNPLAIMDMQMHQSPPTLEDMGVRVPAAVQQIVDKCLEKEPGRRFQSPRELLLALTRALQGEPPDLSYQVLDAARAVSARAITRDPAEGFQCFRCGVVVRVDDAENFCSVCGETIADAIGATGLYWIHVPFPPDSVPSTNPVDINSDAPFTFDYLNAVEPGLDVEPGMRSWEWGATIVWTAWRDYFWDVLQALVASGWELAEPFEQYDSDGLLVDAEDHFLFDEPPEQSPDSSGKLVFDAATFRMWPPGAKRGR